MTSMLVRMWSNCNSPALLVGNQNSAVDPVWLSLTHDPPQCPVPKEMRTFLHTDLYPVAAVFTTTTTGKDPNAHRGGGRTMCRSMPVRSTLSDERTVAAGCKQVCGVREGNILLSSFHVTPWKRQRFRQGQELGAG